MSLKFPLTILYTQLTVFRNGLERPGLLWDDDHVAQGFAWDDETVAFGIPDHDGDCWVDVDTISTRGMIDPRSLWALEVPFSPKGPTTKIGTVGMDRQYPLPVANYALVFEVFPAVNIEKIDYAFLLKLRFRPEEKPKFEILKKGYEITADQILRRDARRA